MNITLKNFVILLGSLLLTCGALSYAMEDNDPARQLSVKTVEKKESELNDLPLEVVHYMTEFLNEADTLHLMQTNRNTYFNDELRVLLFKKIKSAACKGCWKVPTCKIEDYEEDERPLPRAVFFSVVCQSDVDLLNRALALPAGDYLKVENGADKIFLLAIAMHNNFTEGVAILQKEFKMTLEECQELAGNIKFPLTENLLIAAIYLISPIDLDELLNGQDVNFDPSLNDDAILKALVHAVHHRKMAHA